MKQWQISPKIDAEFSAAHPDIDPAVLQLLYNRGLREAPAIRSFLSGELAGGPTMAIGGASGPAFYDPFLFKDMEAAVSLIISHIKQGNRIVVYGDYDADGVTASVILLEALQIMHAAAECYLPDRVTEGYGLNKAAIAQIAEQGYKLIITVDNGTRNKEEVAYAKSRGLDVIITDHHTLPDEAKDLPDCLLINPSDQPAGYPWPYLAGVGVSFKLVCALLLKANLPEKQKKLIAEKCLDLVAVGTVADMVSLLGENRLLVQKGLEVLNAGKRPGLNELLKEAKINNGRLLQAWNIGWQIGPRLNAASRVGHANSAFALLTTTEIEEASTLAAELNQRNLSRQRITEEITAQVEEQIDPNNIPPLIIGLAGEEQIWNEGVIGLVAGRIAEKYYRPTLIIARLVEEAEFDPVAKKLVPKKVSFKGSGRSIEEFNLIKNIEECADTLDKFGGHPMACGFSVAGADRLQGFEDKINALAAAALGGRDLAPKLKIDMELSLTAINLELAAAIDALAPFGQNNPQPRFAAYDLHLDDVVTMGFENQHIKFRLSSLDQKTGRTAAFWAIAFGAAAGFKELKVGDRVDLAYYLEINEFNGRREAQLKIIDIRLHQSSNQ